MDRLTEARAVLAPKRRVSSDTLTTDSFIFEPPIVAGGMSSRTGSHAAATKRRRRPLAPYPGMNLTWHQLALYFGGLQLPHRTSQGVDAEPGSAEKRTETEIDERLVR